MAFKEQTATVNFTTQAGASPNKQSVKINIGRWALENGFDRYTRMKISCSAQTIEVYPHLSFVRSLALPKVPIKSEADFAANADADTPSEEPQTIDNAFNRFFEVTPTGGGFDQSGYAAINDDDYLRIKSQSVATANKIQVEITVAKDHPFAALLSWFDRVRGR